MLFTSITFLYYFLPAVLILYGLAPRRIKNAVLMVSSLIFYGWGEPRHLILMIASILSGYSFARLIESTSSPRLAKLYLILAAGSSLAPLVYFKYANFFMENLDRMSGLQLPVLTIALPVGISFYTFQVLSYAVDVYRKDVPAQRSLIKLAAYITMFPQLIAGPIVRYTDIAPALEDRRHNFGKISEGIRRFVIGFAKKILIANQLGELADLFRNTTDPSVLYYWLYAAAFCLQLYHDFSAYSDMAVGLGLIFGFRLMENFNYPYISRSVTEFWRRWHISLGTWFRDYVYIPLGGNRCSRTRWLFNITVVWLLTGLWHGAAWNFVAWGAYFVVFLVLEKWWLKPYLEKYRIMSHVYTLLVVCISMVIFDAQSLREAALNLSRMFIPGSLPLVSREALFYLREYGFLLILAGIGATPWPRNQLRRFNSRQVLSGALNWTEPVYLVVLLVLATAYLIDGSFNPFLYFRF